MLMFRRTRGKLEVLLAHPGGPYWRTKDLGAWTLPKGLVEPGEDLLTAAKREFSEETGITALEPFLKLGEIRQKSGKHVHAWAWEGDADPAVLTSNLMTVEWPPRSGRMLQFPEVDRWGWFEPQEACAKINSAQAEFIRRLKAALGG